MITEPQNTFQGLGIAPKLMEIIDKLGFKSPTPIQRQSIPVAISGKDLIGIAQTGTGKTLAFGIPMLQRLAAAKTKGLVLAPTRELAVQINESLKQIGRSLGLKTAVIIGGESMFRQLANLRQNPHVIIATPGRLIDILGEKKVNLSNIGVLVLDEADRMLDMGFAPQLKQIIPHLPKVRQTLLFSATMDEAVTNIASAFLKLPLRIEVAPQGSTADLVSQEIIMVNREDKLQLVKKTLDEYKGSTLIFCRTKFGAKKLAEVIKRSGHTAAEIHSNRSLNQRLEALNGFKIGKYRVLVATDIAARGIDVTNIELVINYDLPEKAEDYVHRIGRTARAGKAGHAISFATQDQHSDIRAIERLIKKTVPVKRIGAMPRVDGQQPERLPERTYDRPFRGGRRFSGPSRGFNRPFENRPPRPSGSSFSSRPQKPNPFESGPRKVNPFRPQRPGSKPGGRSNRFAPRFKSRRFVPSDRPFGR